LYFSLNAPHRQIYLGWGGGGMDKKKTNWGNTEISKIKIKQGEINAKRQKGCMKSKY
jgi:hypothetical protein